MGSGAKSGIDGPGCREKAQAVLNFDRVIVFDLQVRVARNDLEQVTFGSDWRRGR